MLDLYDSLEQCSNVLLTCTSTSTTRGYFHKCHRQRKLDFTLYPALTDREVVRGIRAAARKLNVITLLITSTSSGLRFGQR